MNFIIMLKQKNNTDHIFWMLLLLIFTFTACDTEESILSHVQEEEFFQNAEQFESAIGDAYGPMTTWSDMISTWELTTDAVVMPERGQDWALNKWKHLHTHNWIVQEGPINNWWQNHFNGVNNTNRLIFQFKEAMESGNADTETSEKFLAELRVMRAFYYYGLLDNFGNVPLVTSFEDAVEKPAQPSENFSEGQKKVFDFVEKSILDNIDKLATEVGDTYGRMNKWVAHFLLAKLYLNAEIYTGESRWDEVITHTEAIINSSNYRLTNNYRENFITENSGSPEIIFAIPYDEVFNKGFKIHIASLHYGNQATFRLQNQPWNGYSAVGEFYLSYIDSNQNPGPQGSVIGMSPEGDTTKGTLDDRLQNFLVGPQFTADGDRIEDAAAIESDPDGPPLTLTPFINERGPNAWRQAGARINKWEIKKGSSINLNNDFAVYRFSDVLLMNAEARYRMNPNDQEALRKINLIRKRASVTPFKSLDLDKLLAERGRELFFEGWRRQDLIRFDGISGGEKKFNDPWWEKAKSDPTRNIFPIPRDQIEANSNLVQNPGY